MSKLPGRCARVGCEEPRERYPRLTAYPGSRPYRGDSMFCHQHTAEFDAKGKQEPEQSPELRIFRKQVPQ